MKSIKLENIEIKRSEDVASITYIELLRIMKADVKFKSDDGGGLEIESTSILVFLMESINAVFLANLARRAEAQVTIPEQAFTLDWCLERGRCKSLKLSSGKAVIERIVLADSLSEHDLFDVLVEAMMSIKDGPYDFSEWPLLRTAVDVAQRQSLRTSP